MADDEDRVTALMAQIAELRGEVEVLRAAVEGQARATATMRGLLECPHCGGRRVLEAQRVADRTDAGDVPFAVASKGFWARKPVGPFACWICASCGFTEWFVAGAEQLEVDDDRIVAHEIDDSERGPYR